MASFQTLLICLLFNTIIGINAFGLSKHTQTFYSRCIKNRYRHNWFSSIPKAEAKLCLVFLQSQQSNSRRENIVEGNDGRSEPQLSNGYKLIIQYFQGLSMWKSGERDLGPSLLDYISPCWKHSKELESLWKEAYKSRGRDNIAIMSKVISQSWDNEEGYVNLIPANKNHQGGTLAAADLILERDRPSDLGETFGRYHSAVYTMRGNVSARRIHDDFQSSCSSKTGNLMALNLNLIDILPWYERNNHVLRLRVRIEPRRQYFSRSKRVHVTGDRVHVVSRAVGMVLHFTAPPSGTANKHLMKAAMSLRNARTELENTIIPSEELGEMKRKEGRIEENQISNFMKAAQTSNLPVTLQRTIPGRSRHRRSTNRDMRYLHHNQPQPNYHHSPSQPKCYRTPYRFSRDLYSAMKIIYPDHNHRSFNIGKCTGECSFPLSDSVSPTSHAIAKHMDLSKNSTVCCVPLTYRHIFYTAMDENGVPFQGKMNDFMADTCGCR